MENDYYESTPHTIKKQLNDFKNVGGLVTTSEYDIKLNLLSALQNEQRLLLSKMKKSMDEDNMGTYKNLVMALKEITYLVQKEEEKIKNGEMYIDFGIDVSYIYFNGRIISIKGKNVSEVIINKVKDLVNNDKNTTIFLDTRNIGVSLYDRLIAEGFVNVKSVNVEMVRFN